MLNKFQDDDNIGYQPVADSVERFYRRLTATNLKHFRVVFLDMLFQFF